MRTKNLEFKVGIFVITAVTIFMVFILSLGKNRMFGDRITFVVEFDFAEGLKEMSPVNISGHEVGIVKKVNVSFQGKPVYVTLEVDRRMNIPRDSKVFINSLGLLGEKYVEIIPGMSEEYVRDADIIKGVSSVPLKVLSDEIKSLARGFSTMIASLNAKLDDSELNSEVRDLIRNLSNTFAETYKILAAMEKGEGTLGRLIYDDRLYTELLEFVDDISQNPWKLFHVPRQKRR